MDDGCGGVYEFAQFRLLAALRRALGDAIEFGGIDS